MGKSPGSERSEIKSWDKAVTVWSATSRERKRRCIIRELKPYGIAAVDRKDDTGQVTGLIGCQEKGRIGDLSRVTKPAHRGAGKHLLFAFRIAVEGLGGHFGGEKNQV